MNAFDYENPKHVENVATIAARHRDFKQIPDAAKHLAGALSQGSYKFIEDPRIQNAINKAGHSGYFISGKEGKQQIVRKAMGGVVNPIDQMRNELANKTQFKGLSQLQSIGAEEAPSLGVKAYVPPAGRPDNGQMPVGGIDTQQGDLPVGGIDMSQQQAGQQLMPNSMLAPAPAGQQQGMDQVPRGDKIGTMDGTGMPPTPNSNPNQMGSNILSMTPQGQAMAAMKPQGLAKGGKVDVRPTVKDDAATRRTPEIETAIKALQAGIINQKEYDRIVQKYKPVRPYDFVPAPATDEEALEALISTKKPNWRSHEEWPAGHPVGLRLDIPSYEHHGVWVNSIHDESGRGKENFPVSYGPVSAVRNATFEGMPHKAVRVATGEQNKAPFAKIMGELEHIDEKKALAHMKKYLNHPEYRQIGYDPRRHGDFYDRATMQPVESAEHVVQIGPLVLAKKPTYAKKRTGYAEGGSMHYAPAKPLTRQEIEAHADRIARQMAGEENPNKKSKQQLEREKTLQVDIKSGGKEIPIPVINHEEIKGSNMVGVPGDPSRGGVVPRKRNTTRLGVGMPKAGEYLRGVGGQKLESPVPMLGGYKYGAYGHPSGWASDLGASAGLYNVVKKLYEENPEADIYGQYHKMTPASLNHAVHTLDAVLSHHQPHNAPPEVIENLNHLMRNVKTTTSKHDVPYPTFPGFENPNDVMLHGIMNSGMRKKMIGLLGKDKYLSGGKQKMDDLIFALSHPELRNIETGAGGSAIIQFDPTKNLKDSTSPHTTYGYDLPSKLKGRTRYTTPFQLLAPRSNANAIKEIKAMGKEKTVVPFNQAKMNIIREPIDEQYINQLGEYEMAMKKRLGYKSGGKVKLHTDQDTMQLALSKKSKKAK